MNERKFLTGNQLKIIALIAMTCDHIGAYLVPDELWLRVIGRLAFPVFAFMLGEGCRHTKKPKRRLVILGCWALVFQIAAYVALGHFRQFVLVSFFMAALLCISVENALKNRDAKSLGLLVTLVVAVFLVTEVLPFVLEKDLKFSVDYGFFGVLFPVVIFMSPKKSDKLVSAGVMTVMIALGASSVQWYSLAALPLLGLYNGKRGRGNMKHFFYAYFPLHLIVIWILAWAL